METSADMEFTVKYEDLSSDEDSGEFNIDYLNEVENCVLDNEHFQKEELAVFIEEEPGEDPLSDFVQSTSHIVEESDLKAHKSVQEEDLSEFIIEEIVTKWGNSSKEGLERVFFENESEENPSRGKDLQPKTEEPVTNFGQSVFHPESTIEREVDQTDPKTRSGLGLTSLLNDAFQPYGGGDGQQMIENAVDDWYKILVIHGPVDDCEILEAAHQLARHFNVDFSPGFEWLENFKIRQESMGVAGLGGIKSCDVSIQRAGSSAEVLYQSETPEPPRKRTRIEGELGNMAATEIYSEDNPAKQFLSTCDVNKLIDQLVSFHELSKDQAVHWLNVFMDQLIAWAEMSVSSAKKLGVYHVRLKVAMLAKDMGKAGFTFDDEFYLRMKRHFPHSFKDMDIRRTRDKWTPFADIVADWYDAEASKRFVSPAEVERKALDVAKDLGVDPPPKDFVRTFVGHYGLYCDMNGNRTLFMKPRVGLLRCRFELAYVDWYYDWPVVIDSVITDRCYVEEKCWVILKSYMAALTEWYLEMPPNSTLTPFIIETQEVKLAEAMCSPDLRMGVWRTWRKTWIEMTAGTSIKIRYFSSALEMWCKEYEAIEPAVPHGQCLLKIPCWKLQQKAEEIAISRELPFQPTKRWLKSLLIRRAESKGNFPGTEGTLLDHNEKFDLIFEQWYEASGNVDIGYTVRSAPRNYELTPQNYKHTVYKFNEVVKNLYLKQSGCVGQTDRLNFDFYSLKQNAEVIAHNMGLANFIATSVWMDSFLCSLKPSSNELRVVNTSTTNDVPKRLAGPLAKMQLRSKQSQRTAVTVQSNRMTELNAAVGKWYVDESLVRTVLPGELERRFAKATHSNIRKTVSSKHWLERFIFQYGLCYNNDEKRVMLMKYPVMLWEKMFEAEFMVWYHQWPLPVDELITKECNLIDKMGRKVKVYFKAFKFAMLEACAKEPNLTTLRLFQIERQILEDMVPGISTSEVHSLGCMWSKEMRDVVRTIGEFDTILPWKYLRNERQNIDTGLHNDLWSSPEGVNHLALEIANTLGLRGFHTSKSWLKRLFELNGLLVWKVDLNIPSLVYISSGSILKMDTCTFDEMFNAWWDRTPYLGNVEGMASSAADSRISTCKGPFNSIQVPLEPHSMTSIQDGTDEETHRPDNPADQRRDTRNELHSVVPLHHEYCRITRDPYPKRQVSGKL